MPIDRVRALIRDVPDFPQAGIVFKDITPVLADAGAFQDVLDAMEARLRRRGFDRVVAIESRGFIFGAPVAASLGVGFVPVRKPGKLPHRTRRRDYDLEYGTDALEMHADAVVQGARVVVVDDLLATGGTAAATVELVREIGGQVVGATFVVELEVLRGRERLTGIPVDALLSY
jgi:adenine phosphoribosyltransferase